MKTKQQIFTREEVKTLLRMVLTEVQDQSELVQRPGEPQMSAKDRRLNAKWKAEQDKKQAARKNKKNS